MFIKEFKVMITVIILGKNDQPSERQVTHLQVALVGVEDDGHLLVKSPLHLQGQSADGRLEIGLLGIHHESHSILYCMLEKETHTNKLNEGLQMPDVLKYP